MIMAASLLLAWGCFPDERNNFMVDDAFGISSLDQVVEASVHSGTIVIGIAKSGKGTSSATVRVNTSSTATSPLINAYNQANKTNYQAVTESLVTMNQTQFSFAKEDVAQKLVLSWDPEELASFVGNSNDYIIPILIESDDPTVLVKQERSFIMIHLRRSSIKVAQSGISRTVEKKTVEKDKEGNQPPLQESVSLDVVIDNSIKGMSITYPVKIDNSLIAAYNEGQETPFVAAPQGLVKIETPSVTIPEGGKSATVKLTLDYSVLLKDGKLPQFPSYVIPVTLDKSGLTANYNGKEFDLRGLSYGSITAYIVFNWRETKLGLSVRREWGKYSSELGAWSSYIEGFTANADRNVTLDGDYLYIAETNQTKNLWAISLKDPGIYKKLPVGTVKDAGTFYLSCPRVVKNTNEDINGGKDVLVVSNMVSGNPTLYIYDKGIEADPSVITMETWASRRLGDTFTWWGSLQDGVLFFKDFDSTQGTVTFWMKGKTTGTMYLVGRIAAPAVTGAGAYFPFPDNISAGLGSVRGGAISWYIQSTKNLATLEGADNAPTITELAGDWANTCFRFFELGGKRYVACAQQNGSSQGYFLVVEGPAGMAWQQILSDGTVVYQAAIQNESEGDALDTTASAFESGNSGMDLDIYQSGTDVYVAVIKQNVGLSLFHLSYDE